MQSEETVPRVEPVARTALGQPLHPRHAGALADEVDDLAVRDVPAGPSRAGGAEAEIRLFVVHEVPVVEQADALDQLRADHHARARDPVYRFGRVRRGRGDDPLAKQLADEPEAQRAFELAEHGVEAERAVAD